ncbi:MAG: Rrf2 family transcriptional regulator [Lactobacillus sp.]|jgi:Rrf2 family protein|nr:Rrf2 family transcriptional regulator [Lactobacillus sp.]MCH3906311.1 Rrf2 family transcriptional regulator [Lactobacillus sp.]MCH3990115.1 Rrf2 family transcriptional regulator [Lactobacillus sp.]MCH4069171.1 Rrf2 family transcriptional regulator [Lactobacillus sp.]MCI1303473.1 Rrf2 family transcriptional regulator [Lactobacillus sp.]
MKVSTRFSDAIHILAFINIYHGKIPLTSDNIAGSVELSSVMVRKLMSTLKKAGLLETKSGASPDPRLAKPAEDISLLDIYLAVEKDKPLFEIDYDTNPQCIVGGNIQKTLEYYYQEAENAALAKLNHVSLADVIETILVKQKQKEAGIQK